MAKYRYAYRVFGTQLGYKRDFTGNYKTRKEAMKKLLEYKRIPSVKSGTIKNLRIKKVRMPNWQTWIK